MLKVRTLFSGIGSPEIALRDLNIPYELVDFCEVDKYAIQSYCAVHNVDPSKNLGDITKVWGRNLPYADMLVWGFPCTDISVAGKQAGIVEGETRSGLYYEGLRILKDIHELGYNNYWKVLNAKDYGIPQNRERVFIVSIRADVDNGFEFPHGFDNGLRLKDFLEDEVDEKYYISQEKVDKLIQSLKNGESFHSQEVSYAIDANYYKGPSPSDLTNGKRQTVVIPCITPDIVNKSQNGRRFKEDGDPSFTLTSQDRHGILMIGKLEDMNGHDICKRVYSEEGDCPTIPTGQSENTMPKLLVKEATKKGYAEATIGDSINIQFPNSETRRGRVGVGVAQTLETACNQATFTTDYRIRKLTPKECWRLMGFSDEDFQKAADAGVSNSQLYKQAGNSIVSTVLYCIFNNLLGEYHV